MIKASEAKNDGLLTRLIDISERTEEIVQRLSKIVGPMVSEDGESKEAGSELERIEFAVCRLSRSVADIKNRVDNLESRL